MPHLIIEAIHKEKKQVLLLAIKGVTPKAIIKLADQSVSLAITQIGRAIKECKKRNICELSMAGRVPHRTIFSLSLLKMDWLTLKTWWKLPDWRADTILKSVSNLFSDSGIVVMNSVKYLSSYLIPKGILSQNKPSQKTLDDINFGKKIARELGRLDIGQTVVVKQQSIVALEAMEGTDHCLQRAFDLAGPGCCVVKLAKPAQDMRFDVPTIGKNTIEKLIKIKASALAVEAEKTLIVDKDALELAKMHNLCVVGIET